MSTIILDALEFINKLYVGGVTGQQAKAQARAHAELIEKWFATQQLAAEHKLNFQRDIKASGSRIKARIKEPDFKIEALRAESKRDVSKAKTERVCWVVGEGVLQLTLNAGQS